MFLRRCDNIMEVHKSIRTQGGGGEGGKGTPYNGL